MRILHKNELIHPEILMVLTGIGAFVFLGNFEIVQFWEKDFDELLISILVFVVSYFILNSLNTSNIIVIKNKEIIKGIYCEPFGFIKIKERICIQDINEIYIKQNDKLVFETVVELNTKQIFIIKSTGSKHQAEKDLLRIITKINTAVSRSLSKGLNSSLAA